MKITNTTTTRQIAALISPKADERDGRILLGLLSRDLITDTDECDLDELIDEAAALRKSEDDAEADEGGICPACSGSGEGMYDGSTCSTCKGWGEI